MSCTLIRIQFQMNRPNLAKSIETMGESPLTDTRSPDSY